MSLRSIALSLATSLALANVTTAEESSFAGFLPLDMYEHATGSYAQQAAPPGRAIKVAPAPAAKIAPAQTAKPAATGGAKIAAGSPTVGRGRAARRSAAGAPCWRAPRQSCIEEFVPAASLRTADLERAAAPTRIAGLMEAGSPPLLCWSEPVAYCIEETAAAFTLRASIDDADARTIVSWIEPFPTDSHGFLDADRNDSATKLAGAPQETVETTASIGAVRSKDAFATIAVYSESALSAIASYSEEALSTVSAYSEDAMASVAAYSEDAIITMATIVAESYGLSPDQIHTSPPELETISPYDLTMTAGWMPTAKTPETF